VTAAAPAAARGRLRRLIESIPPELAAPPGEGEGIAVAVIDSGVDGTHPALAGRIEQSVEVRAIGLGWGVVEADPIDTVGHGTACAGIIARIAPRCRIRSVRVLGEGNRGRGAALLTAFDWAIDSGSRVINLSLGTRTPDMAEPLRVRVDRAYRAGAVVVAAASNLPGVRSFPSVFASLIAVDSAALSPDDLFRFRFGSESELEAPGIYVKAPWPGGGEKLVTGTSFACPHVSGYVARLLSTDPELRPFQVKTLLYAYGLLEEANA
jgi:subtilisin family serine protease